MHIELPEKLYYSIGEVAISLWLQDETKYQKGWCTAGIYNTPVLLPYFEQNNSLTKVPLSCSL